ncbi:MAG: quinol:electron acceptor oxidoreductase subunit ActD [Planctomycetota bacterium]|jgi:mono/diheme cytochrome c family protein
MNTSEHQVKKNKEPRPPKACGWMAEFENEHDLLHAAEKVRDAGYTKTDAFTPFPVHGIDHALGIKPTILPFIVLCAGLTGLTTALLMQWWMNGVDYRYIISGKPFGITPASIPVSFELTILFSAFTSVLGMLALNGLPKFSNPVFSNSKFDRATNDRFFLYVDASDKYYNRESVRELLTSVHPASLDEVIEDASPTEIPRPIWLGALLLVLAGLIPAAIVLNMRASFSDLPRWHVFFDMDFQPKKKPQQTTTIFKDGRTMRPPVPGTVSREQLTKEDPFYLGYDPMKASVSLSDQDKQIFVSTNSIASAAQTQAADAGRPPKSAMLDKLPIEANEANIKLGKTKYETYCAACHGYAGFGDGLVAKRAASLQQDTWLAPTSLHAHRVQEQSVGDIFYTITKGQGKMAAYASSITPEERWAIVLYVKALQRSRNAKIEDVPVEQRSSLSEQPAEPNK